NAAGGRRLLARGGGGNRVLQGFLELAVFVGVKCAQAAKLVLQAIAGGQMRRSHAGGLDDVSVGIKQHHSYREAVHNGGVENALYFAGAELGGKLKATAELGD